MLGRICVALTLLISSTIFAQLQFERYHAYTNAISSFGPAQRCFDVIYNASSKDALIKDYACNKTLNCYECTFASALFQYTELTHYAQKYTPIPYQDGVLNYSLDALWEYHIARPESHHISTPLDIEGATKGFEYNYIKSKKKSAQNLNDPGKEWEELENKHD